MLPEPSPSKAPTVLIVEDDALQRLFLIDMLEDQGMVVLQAGSALEALRILETDPGIQLLFTDIQLGHEIDGLDLLRIVHMRWPHISLLSTSGQLRPHFGELPQDARFLAKPFQELEMKKQVNELLAGLSYPSSWC